MNIAPLLLAAWLPLAPPGTAAARQPVAIVYALSGTAWVKTADANAKRPAERFEWIPADADLEVGPDSTLRIAFLNGSRYELGGRAKVTLSADGALRSSSGAVRPLAPVPPLPRLEPLAADVKPPAQAGALRIRGGRIEGLYPRDDASVIPDKTELSFELLPGTARYKVQVENELGTAVFDVEIHTASVVVSPGVLRPGSRYHWTVRSLGRTTAARGEADFVTVDAESLAAREKLRRSLQGVGDADSLALLAEVDSRLGLLVEARGAFRAALANAPNDQAIQAALERLERRLSGPKRDP